MNAPVTATELPTARQEESESSAAPRANHQNSGEGNPRIYSLLHVDLTRSRKHVNLKSKSGNPIDTYVACGKLLASSCRYFGISYALVTNETEYVQERVEALGGGVDVCEGDFDRDVPKDASFYSTHFKLDLIRAIGEGRFGINVGLIDIDTVFTKRLNLPADAWRGDRLFAYDISEQEIRSYGQETLRESLEQLGVQSPEHPRWFGGEFFLGNFRAFAELSREVGRYWPEYLKCWRGVHHVGDEMVINAALTGFLRSGGTLIDAGQAVCPNGAPLVSRWWSARTLAPQAPYRIAERAALLHLPSDKLFLARQSAREYLPKRFREAYRNYLFPRLLARRAFNGYMKLIRSDQVRYVGRIS